MEQATRHFLRTMGRWLMALLLVMLTSLATRAAEAYACYTPSNATLTFYYDSQRASRPGTTYDLNTGSNYPAWYNAGIYSSVLQVVFDASFADARPTSAFYWFSEMNKLQTIEGLANLNTSEVTNMANMFSNCRKLTSLDLSTFNTDKVTTTDCMFLYCTGLTSVDLRGFTNAKLTRTSNMFEGCSALTTIYADSNWSLPADNYSWAMFMDCTSLVGGKGTAYDENHTDDSYAHLDGGPSNPGYFTEWKEAYACYTPSNTTLTFYYDNQRSSRTGTTYDLNTGTNDVAWDTDGTRFYVTKVVFDPSFADARPTTTYDWFFGMLNLESITGMSYLNTSEVTNMGYMFQYCYKLTSLDVSHFNTSKVTDMNSMFRNCSSLTSLDLSSFNTSKVTKMGLMFYSCSNLRTIYVGSGWSTAAVTSSNDMFRDCTNLVGGQGTTYNESNPWDKTYAHIDGGPSNPGYFTGAPEAYACFTQENTTLTFYYDSQRASRPGTTYDLNTDSNNPDWYSDGTSSSVTRVEFAESFADVRPTSTYMWFYGMENVHSITGLNYLNTENVTNMGAMFMSCTVLASLDLSSFNTANVTGMSCMFLSCYALTSLDVSNFNTAKVTNMHEMFAGCSGLTSLDVSSFNTANVTNMRYMFSGCSGLTSLDLSSFNIENVVYMHRMFSSCSGLKTIYVGDGWSTAAVTESTDMFYNCTRLVGGMGTTYDANHTDKTYAHIDGGPSNPGYFTAKNASLRGDVDADGNVTISDVTALIDYLLSGNASGVNLTAADCDLDGGITISDVTALIDYLLSGRW